MTRTTISERVLAYLKEQPGTPLEIARALKLKRRKTRMGYTYYWGHWNFGKAETEGLIVWRGDKWHLVKRNPFTSVGLNLLFEARRTDDVEFLKQWSRDAVTWYESEKGRLIKLYEKLSSEYKAMAERALNTRQERDKLKDKIEAVKKLHDEFRNIPTYSRMRIKLGKILEA